MRELPSSVLRSQLLSGERILFSETAADDARRIDASWLRDAALQGVAIDVSNAVISGPADLRSVRFDHDVRIVASKFEEYVDFSYADFQRTVDFSHTVFSQGVSCDSTRFRSDVLLNKTRFGRRTNSDRLVFNDSDFGGVLDASNAQFPNEVKVSFTRANFRRSAYFNGAEFGGPLNFSQVQASGALEFAGASFRGILTGDYLHVGDYLGLANTRFKKTAPVSLQEIVVDGSLYCNGARFGSSFDLSASHVHSSFQAVRACFLGPVQFRECSISGRASFRSSRFGRRAPADFRSASFSKGVDISDALLKRDVDFSDLTVTSNFETRGSRFLGMTSFGRACVAGWLQMASSHFEKVNLEKTQIAGVVDCTGVVFAGPFTARDSRLGTFIFNGQAHDLFDLYGAQLKGALILSGAQFRGRPLALDIAGVDVGTQAYFDGACFRGKLNAIGLSIAQQFSFNKVVCGGEVDFYELTVKRGFFLWETRVRRSFKLDSATIGGELYLSAARFLGSASFAGTAIRAIYMSADPDHHNRATDFRGGVSFVRAQLGYLGFQGVRCRSVSTAGDFAHIIVKGVANFSDARFEGNVRFYSSLFGGEAIFQRVRFGGPDPVDLRGAAFENNVSFAPAVFTAGVDFTSAKFDGLAMFRALFGGQASFDSCYFRGVADFSDVEEVKNEAVPVDVWALERDSPMPRATQFAVASFVHARFGADANFQIAVFRNQLDLREAKFVSLFLPTEVLHAHQTLPDSIDMRGCTYEEISVAARQFLIKKNGDERLKPYDREAYKELEQTLRATGNDDAANEVHLLWRRAERRHLLKKRHPFRWLLSWAYLLLAHYGIRPYRLAVLSVALIAFGTLYFEQPGTMKLKDSKESDVAYSASRSEAFGMSLGQFLPVSIPLGEELVPTNRKLAWNFSWRKRSLSIRTTPVVVATILKLFGWILVPLGIASLTGVLRRLPGR